MKANKRPNIPLTLTPNLDSEIRQAAIETELSLSEVMRQSIRFGLPRLRSAFRSRIRTRSVAPRSAE